MSKVLAPLVAVLGLAALAVATVSAAPCGPTTCAPVSTASAAAQTLLVRPQGQSGPLHLYDLATGRVRARLPAGVASADGRRFVVTQNGVQSTKVIRYDTRTGERIGSMRLGQWNLKPGAVSADGRYAALVWGTKDPDISIVDLERGRLVRKVHLDGQWAVDALSRDGRRLYLLEYSQTSYRVRLHDAAAGLLPDAIVDPREPEPMTGTPWSSVGTADGRLQLTLYLKGGAKTEPFVHALSLGGPRAACVDLPGGDFVAAGRYALVLAPNGRTLYAANPSLGVVATIDLQRKAVVSTARFARVPVTARNSTAFGAISPDGRSLYFSGGGTVVAYDVRARTLRGRYSVGPVVGVGVQPSGRALVVVKEDGTAVRLDATTGAPVQS